MHKKQSGNCADNTECQRHRNMEQIPKQIECQIDDRSKLKKTAEMTRQLALEFTLHNTQSMAYTLEPCF